VQAPSPKVTPQVGVYTVEHDDIYGLYMNERAQQTLVQPARASSGRNLGRSNSQP
jgi:hypothetical protein